MDSETGEEGVTQDVQAQPDTASSPMQQFPDQSNYMDVIRSPEVTGTDNQDLVEQGSAMDAESGPEKEDELEKEDEDISEARDQGEIDQGTENAVEPMSDDGDANEEVAEENVGKEQGTEKCDSLETEMRNDIADVDEDIEESDSDGHEVKPEVVSSSSDKGDAMCENDNVVEDYDDTSENNDDPSADVKEIEDCDVNKNESEIDNKSAIDIMSSSPQIEEMNTETDNVTSGNELSKEDVDVNSDKNSDIIESENLDGISDIQGIDNSEQNNDIQETENSNSDSNFDIQEVEKSDKISDIQEIDNNLENISDNQDIGDSDVQDIHSSEMKSSIQEKDNLDDNYDIQEVDNSDIEDIVETSDVCQEKTETEQDQSMPAQSQTEESNGAKIPIEELTNIDDNSQAESNDFDSEIYDIGPQGTETEKPECETKADVGEEESKAEEAQTTAAELKDDDKDEGELSEASLEEVSEEEDEKDDKAAESGIEEVSDEEEEEEQGNVSGVEEVSDEEEDDDAEEVTGDIVEVDLTNRKGGGKDASQNGDGAKNMSDDKIVNKKKKPTREYEEGEEEDESGMEEVSDEEEEEKSESEEEAEDEDGQKEEGSEGMEDVSSEEEEEEDPGVKPDTKTDEVTDERTVEIKQNGEVVKIDDTGKEDSEIVQEILENMTIKIDNVGKAEKRTAERSERKHRDRQEKEKSKRKKERRESVKSRGSSSAMKSEKKDTRDINERLKAQASYGEDIELDYDDVHDELKDKNGSESGCLSTSESDEGELIDEEDCEEGEIREPGQKPFIKPTCRFFMRGHCTWGVNCRFLHPGINDKGYYQLIERPGFNNKPPAPYDEQAEDEERSPSPEPPPPAKEPKEETAWERGLRQAKELRKKALERRELDTNFEHKKMNLSIEENPEYNKENTVEEEKRPPKKKPYYYEKEVFSDDEYYDQTPVRQQQKQQQEQSWMPGQYENFEVRWTRDSHYPPPQGNYSGPYPHPPQHVRYAHYEQSFRGRDGRFQQPRSSQRQFSPSPPPHYQGNQRYPRMQRDPRMDMARREKIRERLESPPPQKPFPHNPSKARADEWHDPWRRSNANKPKSPVRKRSRSRGRRRSRRSHSYSSSYSSSSYSDSSRSRSRSSSYSSVSSRSRSRSRSSSASSRRSSPRRNISTDRRRHPPGNFPPNRRFPQQDHPRSTIGFRGQGRGRSPDKRPGMNRGSPMKGVNKGPMPMQQRGPMSQGRVPGHDPRAPMPQRAPIGKIADVGRRPERGPPPTRKFLMEVKQRDRQLPPSGLKDKRMPGRRRTTSTSRSRSRSSSRSSSSRSSSYSRSSSGSRSSSSSSSGSADSDHLYRNIGGKDNQKQPPAQRGRPAERGRYRHHPDGRQKMPPKPEGRSMMIRDGEFGKPLTAPPQKPKDPLKMTGQKSNIKLTLIKPSDKSAGGGDQMGKKRPADHDSAGPPPKRPTMASQAKPPPEKIPKKPEKANPVSPTKPLQSPVKAAPPPVPVAAVKKKSTVNRREELLKQLKAVEDAIAKKKKKMT